MDLMGRGQPILIMAAAIIGIVLGDVTPLGAAPSTAVEIFLMMLLFVLFLSVDLRKVSGSFANIRFTGAALAINFLFTPVLAYLLGIIFFPDSVDIRIGLLMLLVTPCTDWYIVFTGMSKGNVELGLSILPLNLILQIILMPVYLLVFIGDGADMHTASLLVDMAVVLAVPLAASLIFKRAFGTHERIWNALSEKGDHLQLLFLCLAVAVMFASEGDTLMDNPAMLLELFIPLLIFFTGLLAVAQAIGRGLGFPRRDIVSLNFTTLARNSPLALAIAVATFPDSPLISLALVIGPLIELPVLSLISAALLKWNTKEDPKTSDGCP